MLRALRFHLWTGFDLEHKAIATGLGWSVYLWRAQTFATQSPIYGVMQRLAGWLFPGGDDEMVWGLSLFVASLIHAAGLLAGWDKTRRTGALMVAGVWLAMTLCFFLASPRSPASWTYLLLVWGNLRIGLGPRKEAS